MGAMPEFKIDLRGDKELIRILARMSGSVERDIVGKSVNRAMQPLVSDMRRRAPIGPTHEQKTEKGKGVLKKSIGKRIRKYSNGVVVVYAGPMYPAGAHAHLVEFGTIPRFREQMGGKFRTRKRGKYSTGTMPAQPFMRPAYMSKRALVIKRAQKFLWENIRKEAAKNANR